MRQRSGEWIRQVRHLCWRIELASKETNEKWMKSPSNFERLVLGCIDSYDSNQILIFSGFSRSTRFAHFCTAQISKFQQKSLNRRNFWRNENEISFFHFRFSMKFAIFRRKFNEILPEFHRNVQEMKNCLDILRKRARKIRKMLEISGICAKFSFFISFFHSSPY